MYYRSLVPAMKFVILISRDTSSGPHQGRYKVIFMVKEKGRCAPITNHFLIISKPQKLIFFNKTSIQHRLLSYE